MTKMKDFKVALQLYSVRDNMAEDFEGTLKKVKELGYDGVEFAGLFDKTPAEVKKLVDEIGLCASFILHGDLVNLLCNNCTDSTSCLIANLNTNKNNVPLEKSVYIHKKYEYLQFPWK